AQAEHSGRMGGDPEELRELPPDAGLREPRAAQDDVARARATHAGQGLLQLYARGSEALCRAGPADGSGVRAVPEAELRLAGRLARPGGCGQRAAAASSRARAHASGSPESSRIAPGAEPVNRASPARPSSSIPTRPG